MDYYNKYINRGYVKDKSEFLKLNPHYLSEFPKMRIRYYFLATPKGSAIPMVLIIMMIMSVVGIALLGLIYNEFMSNIIMGNLDRAYYSAEAGIEIIEENLNTKVIEAQKSAQELTSNDINLYINDIIKNNTVPDILNSDGSIKYDIIKPIYNSKYKDNFEFELTNPAGFFVNINDTQNLNTLIGNANDENEPSTFIDSDNLHEVKILSGNFDFNSKSVTLIVQGDYIHGAKTLSQKISVTFSILDGADNIHYQPVFKTIVQKSDIPEILTKAVVCEKNLISAGGEVDILGDVLCFGTIPAEGQSGNFYADGYKYGGLIVGIPDIGNLSYNGKTFDEYFELDTSKIGNKVSGSINILKDDINGIEGNISTMGHVHTLFSNIYNKSKVYVQGSTFSKQLGSESQAAYSELALNNVYTIDNLQLDADYSDVSVNGKYYGMVSTAYDIDGSGRTGDDSTDLYKYRNSSSIIINGLSTLKLNGTSNGGIYINGSSFIKKMVEKDNYPGEEIPYMTGISALKSGSRLKYAYMEYNATNDETRLYKSDNSYLSLPGFLTRDYIDITDTNNVIESKMLNGTNANFNLQDRAAHFKGLWENVWKNHDLYKRYVDTTSINIDVDEDQKINGFAAGLVIANGSVYNKDNFKGTINETNIELMKRGTIDLPGWIGSYHEQLKPLIKEPYDFTKPKLNYALPTKHIFDVLDSTMISNFSEPEIIYNDQVAQGFVFVSTGECNIKNEAGKWTVNGYEIPLHSGFIIADGNVYIEDGFTFDGVILTSKNLVFLGQAKINYNKLLINNMLVDSDVAKFFKSVRYLIGDDAVKGERVSNKNIKLINWEKLN